MNLRVMVSEPVATSDELDESKSHGVRTWATSDKLDEFKSHGVRTCGNFGQA